MNGNLRDSQSISLLLATSSETSSFVTESSTNENMIRRIRYESVAYVILQCDSGSTSLSCPSPSTDAHSSAFPGNYTQNRNSMAHGPSKNINNSSNNNISRLRTNPEKLREYELNIRFNSWIKYGHFASDHHEDTWQFCPKQYYNDSYILKQFQKQRQK